MLYDQHIVFVWKGLMLYYLRMLVLPDDHPVVVDFDNAQLCLDRQLMISVIHHFII